MTKTGFIDIILKDVAITADIAGWPSGTSRGVVIIVAIHIYRMKPTSLNPQTQASGQAPCGWRFFFLALNQYTAWLKLPCCSVASGHFWVYVENLQICSRRPLTQRFWPTADGHWGQYIRNHRVFHDGWHWLKPSCCSVASSHFWGVFRKSSNLF